MKKLRKKTGKRKRIEKRVTRHGPPRSESELINGENEDFLDAWRKLKAFEQGLGAQRIYTSEKAIMFARRICHAFVRPKKSYLELCFFLPEPIANSQLKTQERSRNKFVHTYRLIHADQVEEPLTDWLRQAYERAD